MISTSRYRVIHFESVAFGFLGPASCCVETHNVDRSISGAVPWFKFNYQPRRVRIKGSPGHRQNIKTYPPVPRADAIPREPPTLYSMTCNPALADLTIINFLPDTICRVLVLLLSRDSLSLARNV